jgi:hypothetical protein
MTSYFRGGIYENILFESKTDSDEDVNFLLTDASSAGKY